MNTVTQVNPVGYFECVQVNNGNVISSAVGDVENLSAAIGWNSFLLRTAMRRSF
jgi:hypothetical protein